ncbi:Csu type fimbrial protein [Pseudoduganella aquatica]|jgi:spore coat protein U-like protein|uniref:Fimbrial major subunit CsuA/B family protein n=1 Tax=Pseudoduganella aquatica TaxID=2660641 RepID=A0A7X4HH61_9BURK|nr:spore coat U domain-containing protein [Pseudoduganella aquatica]MYN11085.1 fimbrial major subunit CsuA/B family protein [Pseudoduganella aquatica]
MLPAKITRLALAAIVVAAAPAITGAAVYSNGSKTATFDVTMRIIADCTVSANALDFGQNQGVLAATVTGTTTLGVTCTSTTPYNVGLSAGNGTGSSGTVRYMSGQTAGNTGTVQFMLYQTAGATIWGEDQGVNTKGGTGNGTLQTHTVYGSIPAQTTPAPDTYKSTITATVFF